MSTPFFKRRSTHIIGTVLILLVAVGAWKGKHKASTAAVTQTPPIEASVALVKQQDVPIYLTGVGTVTANANVTVRTRIDGQLDKVAFIEGQDVKAGQLLAQIDARALQAQLEQAQAQKSKDQAQLSNARLDLQRYTVLREQDAATQQTLDTQKALVGQLGAALKTDDAQISYAKVQLGYTTINAPISGRVGARLIDAGNIVHAADATGLVVINQIDPITTVFTLPEDNFQIINKSLQGSHPPLKVAAFDRNNNQPLSSGHLTLLNNQIDTTSGTVQLKATFENPTHVLWPGQYVNVRLYLADLSQALTVPAAAVQRGQDGTYVYVVGADNSVKPQAVHVVQIQDGTAVIDKGVVAGEKVVTDGQYKLKPGDKIVETDPSTAATAKPAAPATTPATAASTATTPTTPTPTTPTTKGAAN
ncbi:efflux RND transporter periplasmic adaptor subunit [Glaciimonas immobilis]|uniref:Multidrug efflux system membrane fusion protein n=1 Tax=Glaciimonas immobilis TaxID=728004 RepID=A0A840RZH1_9BURK|nr:efflux RND transporter periplasmic adaptor subunit [Glaciimonas immobilis]KAF3996663.1 efflux RND transporter periplasmic adaptor subunit [Glaciimonas immobilis]MBB5202508.1 multidrug efflux system membrane fusion protein [Glaciimonas immobilis]